MSFPRYPKYKPSGVEWLGDVPDGWEVKPLKYSTLVYTGNSLNETEKKLYESTDQEALPYISSKDIDLETHAVQYENGLRIPKGQNDLKVAQSGTFLLCIEGGSAGRKVALLSHDVCFVNKLCCFSSTQNNKFRFYFAQSQNFKEKFGLSLTGLIGGVSTSLLKNFQIPTPSDPEQTAIAEFLDRETGKIDELVAEQRRLMELLKEKRQAVISHAVTKGLNPHAPMKPSGIEWLGDVPVGWVIGKLGYASKLRGGFAFAAADFGTEGVAVVKMNNLKRGRLDLTEAARIPESSCNGTVALLEGDLVWGMSGSTGETGSLGNFARVVADDLPCQLNQRVGRFQVDSSKLDLNFVEQVIQTPYFYEQIMLLVTGTAQYNVSSEQVQSCIFALPPLSEQTTIVEFLKTETAKFDALTAEAQRAIDLLQERRTALISAAVTGQIDVRTKAAESSSFNPIKNSYKLNL
ncbi:MAG: restriction endonuclease subunit S [Verrucomicrobia bacterium]|nr:restriction endonuclease subunit S [Verrucomicrobiota bacterium]